MESSEIIRSFNKMKYGEDSLLTLMKFRVREVLFISSLYDAYMLQHEGTIDDDISRQFKQLGLDIPPHITIISAESDIMSLLKTEKFDLVINMMRVGKKSIFDTSKKIKQLYPDLPILLLLNKLSYSNYQKYYLGETTVFDDIFIWNGDPRLFVAMINYIEDIKNVQHDTEVGSVSINLLIETSQDYFSRFLTLYCSEGIRISRELIHLERNDINKLIRMRLRPKILVAHNYSDAMRIFRKYQKYINSVISNVDFYDNKDDDSLGGYKLCKAIRKLDADVPILLQSSNVENRKYAEKLNADFIDKNSKNFFLNLKKYLYNLGYGDLIFEDNKGKEVLRVTSVCELENSLKDIPDDSIILNSKQKKFSKWVQAHGEIQAAEKIRIPEMSEFKSVSDLRLFLLNCIKINRMRKDRGKIVKFEEHSFFEDEMIIRLADGSLGGKGRGLAFLNAITVAFEMRNQVEGVKIIIPKTAIIGTNEFDRFMEDNAIFEKISNSSDLNIMKLFLTGKISDELRSELIIFLKNYNKPLAIRSSGLLEDSQSQPFAGIYQTYIIPNSSENFDIRLEQIENAIKLVFSSPFLKRAKDYINSIGNKMEEEKMAVIIQEVAGSKQQDDEYYYPHISGVAQSHNFYPSVGRKASDGVATIAVGFGKAVVDGERAYRFCPKWPKHDLLDVKSQIENCQWNLYGLDLDSDNYDILVDDGLKKIDITSKLLENNLRQLSTVWDYQNIRFIDGKYAQGDRVITFRNITKFEQFPLNEILIKIMEIGEIGMGVPVEIEFAVDLSSSNKFHKPVFNILQIRPMTVNDKNISIDFSLLDEEKLIVKSKESMGNMVISDIFDIIYIDPNTFKNTETIQMVAEIEYFNKKMREEKKRYVLIGPGRWGTSDRFLGVPITWSQIDCAKIIVEADLENFIVDSSQGSHFFHNLVAAQVGYLKVPFHGSDSFLDWDKLKKSEPIEELKYSKHVRFDKAIKIKIDGKTGFGALEIE